MVRDRNDFRFPMEVIEMLTCSTNEGRRQTKEFETIEFCPEPQK
jgi:hypothetical protein